MTKFSGRTSAYAHKFDDWATKDISDVKKAVRKVTILDAQWSNCPVEVEDQVKDLWRHLEFGNDHYYADTTLQDLREMDEDESAETNRFDEKEMEWKTIKLRTNLIVEYLEANGVAEEEQILIHWWW